MFLAKTCKQQNKYHFYFAGCGWKAKDVIWNPEDVQWIKVTDKLMSLMFGEDFFEYVLDAKKTCHVQNDFCPKFSYNREEWNCEYEDMVDIPDNVVTIRVNVVVAVYCFSMGTCAYENIAGACTVRTYKLLL